MLTRRQLLTVLDNISPTALNGPIYRGLGAGYSLTDGEGARQAGGRWNSPGSFPVLYTALEIETVSAEIVRGAVARGYRSMKPYRLITYDATLVSLLDLTDPSTLSSLDIDESSLVQDDVALPRDIGDAAHYVGFEGIIAKSAANPNGTVVAVYINQLGENSSVTPVREDALLLTLPTI